MNTLNVRAFLICIPLFLLNGLLYGESPQGPRVAVITLSNGETVRGKVSLYPRNLIRIVTAAGENTANTGRSKENTEMWGKERDFGIDVVKKISFAPRPKGFNGFTKEGERYDKNWKWAGPNSKEKIFSDLSYPVRELIGKVEFTSGETLIGNIQSIAFYLQKEKAYKKTKFLHQSKKQGKEGQKLSDLVYMTSIEFVDQGKQFSRTRTLVLAGERFKGVTEVRCLNRKELTPIPVKKVSGDRYEISFTMGQDVFMAYEKDGIQYAQWPPDNVDPELWALAEASLADINDYFNDRELLGIYPVPNTETILTLVKLRRRIMPIARDNSEFDVEFGEPTERSRFSIWRWSKPPDLNEMTLLKRGTFFRRKHLVEDFTPEMKAISEIWEPVIEGNTITYK
ncbi:MAG: hypothetical protein AAF065_08625 [Verrucomicrobiota bacterium]